MFGHAAATMRAALKAKGWTIPDFNQAMGRERGYAGAHVWFAGKGLPGPKHRDKVAKVLSVSAEDLKPRQHVEVTLSDPSRSLAVIPAPTASQAARKSGDVLLFAVDAEGVARLRLDVALPIEKGAALLRMLLDAGIVMGGES
jgi:hypothetical protein